MKTILETLAADPNLSPEFSKVVAPVRLLPCPRCHGLGWVDDGSDTRAKLCPTCLGRMRIATAGGEV